MHQDVAGWLIYALDRGPDYSVTDMPNLYTPRSGLSVYGCNREVTTQFRLPLTQVLLY